MQLPISTISQPQCLKYLPPSPTFPLPICSLNPVFLQPSAHFFLKLTNLEPDQPSFKMKSSTVFITLGLTLGANAFWRLECRGRVGLGRIDPLVAFGKPSQHVHAIHGSSGKLPPHTCLASTDISSQVSVTRLPVMIWLGATAPLVVWFRTSLPTGTLPFTSRMLPLESWSWSTKLVVLWCMLSSPVSSP